MAKDTEGYAFIGECCVRCSHPILTVHDAGTQWKLSTRSVPVADARVLSKYREPTFNVWPDFNTEMKLKGRPIRFHVAYWDFTFPDPLKGRLYVRHICRVWR